MLAYTARTSFMPPLFNFFWTLREATFAFFQKFLTPRSLATYKRKIGLNHKHVTIDIIISNFIIFEGSQWKDLVLSHQRDQGELHRNGNGPIFPEVPGESKTLWNFYKVFKTLKNYLRLSIIVWEFWELFQASESSARKH